MIIARRMRLLTRIPNPVATMAIIEAMMAKRCNGLSVR
jgi:hypothetical protein